MAYSTGEYSRFARERWIRQTVNGIDLLWRPYRLRRRLMPDSMEPLRDIKADSSMTLWSLAAGFYQMLSRPEELWWLIADANSIVDPTIAINGKDIAIPPLRLLEVDLELLPTEDE